MQRAAIRQALQDSPVERSWFDPLPGPFSSQPLCGNGFVERVGQAAKAKNAGPVRTPVVPRTVAPGSGAKGARPGEGVFVSVFGCWLADSRIASAPSLSQTPPRAALGGDPPDR
jgi:hypothetical protein